MTEPNPMAGQRAAENVVFIGIKPVMQYVLAVNPSEPRCWKRHPQGTRPSDSRAVDVAEIVRNRFLQNMVVQNISLGTEAMQGESGATNVSTIEIVLGKK